jgi:hypothetical protein
MARPPKSTAELKLHGNYREDRHGDRCDESMAIGEPQKPDDLEEIESWAWDIVIGGLLPAAKAQIDAPLLIGLCRWYARWCEYDRRMRAGEGDEYKNLVMAATAWKAFERCASRFGMSPADRAKLKLPASEKKADEFEDFLKQHA